MLKIPSAEQLNGISHSDPSESDTSSESDIADINDLREMRDIISRMDDDEDGAADLDEYDFLLHAASFKSPCICMPKATVRLISSGLTMTVCPMR